jgi:arsenate reductase
VHPAGLKLLRELGHPTDGFQSKSWDEFAADGAPQLDFIFTVCDNAAGEGCPVWPGRPMTAHWGIEDPTAAEPEQQDRAFRAAFYALQRRIQLFLALPLESIAELSLQTRLHDIGKTADARQDAE